MIHRIKALYNKVEDKQAFILKVAEVCDKVPATLQNHWFSGYFSIPKKYLQIVIDILRETIQIQISELNNLLKPE